MLPTKEVHPDFDIKLSPNPVGNTFKISIVGKAFKKTEYQIFNTVGQDVDKGFWNREAMDINVARLNTRLYFLELRIGNAFLTSTRKLK